MINEIMVTYSGYARKTTTQPRYQYDIGQVLVFNADFPSAYEVHLQSGASAVKVIANDNRALLPDSLLETGENIRGWMYLPTSESANTLFEFEIPVIKRPQGEEVTPTPQEQGIIEQAIELINSKLADLSSAVARAEDAAESAEEAAESASGGGITQEVDPTVPQWAKEPTKPMYTAVEVGALPSDTPIPTVPSKVSAFENDRGYITNLVDDLANYYLKSETYTKDEVAQLINGFVTISGITPSITALPGTRYVCGEVLTLNIILPPSGIVDVTFTSGSVPTSLTIISETGHIKWANDFDPATLKSNTTYEINIMNGMGVAASWT